MGEKGRWKGGIRPYEAACSAPTLSPIQLSPPPAWNAICRFFLFRCRKRHGLSCIAACIRPVPQTCLYPLSQRSHLTPWAALIPSHTSCGLSTTPHRPHIVASEWAQNEASILVNTHNKRGMPPSVNSIFTERLVKGKVEQNTGASKKLNSLSTTSPLCWTL